MAYVPQSPAHVICQPVVENERVTQKPQLKTEAVDFSLHRSLGFGKGRKQGVY